MILLRTETVDRELAEFAARLAEWSGQPVTYVIDERKAPAALPTGSDKISLTDAACEAIGLYCPHDFAWRCGDYGPYLARQKYPEVERFWLFESDVRLIGTRPEAFFECFAARDEPFLASYIRPAPADWFWNRTLINADRKPYQCFFPVCRFSAAALDSLLDARQRQSQHWSRRRAWPNDEGFVATSLIGDGFAYADLNDFGSLFYDRANFGFETLIDGDRMPDCKREAALCHPVLYDDALTRKRNRLDARKEPKSRAARIRARLDNTAGPSALVRKRNAALAWRA